MKTTWTIQNELSGLFAETVSSIRTTTYKKNRAAQFRMATKGDFTTFKIICPTLDITEQIQAKWDAVMMFNESLMGNSKSVFNHINNGLKTLESK